MVNLATERQYLRLVIAILIFGRSLTTLHCMRMTPDDVDPHAYLSWLVADEELMSFRIRLEPLTLTADCCGGLLADHAGPLSHSGGTSPLPLLCWCDVLCWCDADRLHVGFQHLVSGNGKEIRSSKRPLLFLAHAPRLKGVVDELFCKLFKEVSGSHEGLCGVSSTTNHKQVCINNTHRKDGM
jgi:hypothetical protein